MRAAEASLGDKRGHEFDSTITDLKILAQLARFHARRAVAAVHYNLFKRSQNAVELPEAVREESAAVGAWRQLVTAAGDRYNFDLAMGARNFSLCGHWRDDLAKLEGALKELEAQRGLLPDSTPQEKAWQPATGGDREPPRVEHERVRTARAGQPLRVGARVTDSSGVQSVRLRYRHVTQFEDYATLDLQPSDPPEVFTATVPGDFLITEWDFMYFIEVTDKAGNGVNWPDFTKEMPYVIVKVERK